jgi:hypothetical protein
MGFSRHALETNEGNSAPFELKRDGIHSDQHAKNDVRSPELAASGIGRNSQISPDLDPDVAHGIWLVSARSGLHQ